IHPSDAQWLTRMKSARHVNIGQFVRAERINDWSWLAAMPNLQKLEVTLWNATDEGVLALAQFPAKQQLGLTGPGMAYKSLEHLCDLPVLHHLSLNGDGFRLSFPNGKKLPDSLESIELHGHNTSDRSLEAIAELPRLNRIWINGGKVS